MGTGACPRTIAYGSLLTEPMGRSILAQPRTKAGAVDRAKGIATETELALLIRAAPTKRDRLMLEVGYAGGLRVSEFARDAAC
jgi:hypothetical protein